MYYFYFRKVIGKYEMGTCIFLPQIYQIHEIYFNEKLVICSRRVDVYCKITFTTAIISLNSKIVSNQNRTVLARWFSRLEC